MLKLIVTAMVAGAALTATYLPAAAHGKGIDARQERQSKAIERGRQTGAITWREGHMLRAQQRKIARLEERFRRSGGHLDHKERAVLKDLLRQQARNIRREKNDSYRRWSALPRVGK